MQRVTYKHQAYHNATGDEIEGLLKEGWTVVVEEEWKKIIDSKRKIKAQLEEKLEKSYASKEGESSEEADASKEAESSEEANVVLPVSHRRAKNGHGTDAN